MFVCFKCLGHIVTLNHPVKHVGTNKLHGSQETVDFIKLESSGV